MNCERCNKRLSRKAARQIDGKVICSACLFPKLDKGRPAKAIETRSAETVKQGSVEDESAAPKGFARKDIP